MEDKRKEELLKLRYDHSKSCFFGFLGLLVTLIIAQPSLKNNVLMYWAINSFMVVISIAVIVSVKYFIKYFSKLQQAYTNGIITKNKNDRNV